MDEGRLTKIFRYEGTKKVPIEIGEAGDIVIIAGLEKANVAREVLYGRDTAPIEFMDVLHVGDSFSKDFVGARDAGMRAVLLDRFGRDAPDEESSEGKQWREAGAAVVHDLSDVLEHVARSDFALGCHESRV